MQNSKFEYRNPKQYLNSNFRNSSFEFTPKGSSGLFGVDLLWITLLTCDRKPPLPCLAEALAKEGPQKVIKWKVLTRIHFGTKF